jgi:hypothetical protein
MPLVFLHHPQLKVFVFERLDVENIVPFSPGRIPSLTKSPDQSGDSRDFHDQSRIQTVLTLQGTVRHGTKPRSRPVCITSDNQ